MDELTANLEPDLLRPLWTPALDPLFWPASRAGVESAWTAHVPFAHYIVTAHRPSMIVELGTHNGVSYAAFCEAVQRTRLDCRCLAVDTWQGDEHAGFYGEAVYADLRRFHDLRYGGFSELVRSTFDQAVEHVPDGAIDLLHIDGLHTYDAVRHDLESWRPKLSSRAVLLLHDTNVRERDFGVWRLLAELSREYPTFEFLHGHGLGVVLIGSEVDAPMRALTQLSHEAASAVRTRFAVLGERWDVEMRLAITSAGERRALDAIEAAKVQAQTREQQWQDEVGRISAELIQRYEPELAALRHDLARAKAEAEAYNHAREAQWQSEVERIRADADAQRRTEIDRIQADLAASAQAHEQARGRLAQVEAAWRQSTEAEQQSRLDLAAARAELATIRRDAGQARAAAFAAHVEIGAAKSDADKARQEYAGARAEAEHDRLRREAADTAMHHAQAEAARARHEADAARRAEAAARHDAEHARHQAKVATAEAAALRGSTLWRATKPVRGIVHAVPSPVTRTLRRGPKLLWWTLRLQLPARLRERDTIASRARLVAASPHFDRDWYLATNPDVAVSRIEPALHYAMSGGNEGRDPGPYFRVPLYLERHPEAANEPGGPFIHALTNGTEEDGRPAPVLEAPLVEPERAAIMDAHTPVLPAPGSPSPSDPAEDVTPPPLDSILSAHFGHLAPLPVYAAPHHRRRVTIVTDSINAGSLYGGVGTALLLGVLTAKRLDADLRLITRTERADMGNIEPVLRVHGLSWTGEIESLFVPRAGLAGGRDVPVSDTDILLTTSWWTTWPAREAAPARQIVYLLQEDERMFYPFGDDQLRCSETLSDPDVFTVVNSHLLLDHLQQTGAAKNAVAFEPAFPEAVYHPGARPAGAKRRFFFYGRQFNARNLYWRGLEAIRGAIEDGAIDPAEWDFFFVGRDQHRFVLPGGIKPNICENMPWTEYAALVRTIDVGLSLMYTPHPSYPPLDLAASGAVVVTNRFGPKQSLAQYSENIICADATVPGLVDGLRQAVALAGTDARSERFARNGLLRDWSAALAPAVEAIAARAGA